MPTRAVVDAENPNGFRTFTSLEPTFSRVIFQKLQARYTNVEFRVLTADGDPTKDGRFRFRFVRIEMSGPQKDIDSAYEDAAPFLNTGKQTSDRWLQRTWSPSAEDLEQTPLNALIKRAPACAAAINIHVNYSYGTKNSGGGDGVFFITTVALRHEAERRGWNRANVMDEMVREAKRFLMPNTGQAFRGLPRGSASNAPKPPPADASAASKILTALNQMKQLPAPQWIRAMRDLVDSMEKDIDTMDVLTRLHTLYEMEKAYALAEMSINETYGVSVRHSKVYSNMVELHVPHNAGLRPFTQRFPRVECDQTVLVKLPNSMDVKAKIYLVKDFSLDVHCDDEGVAKSLRECALHNMKVALTFDCDIAVRYRSTLQAACLKFDAYRRVRGIEGYQDAGLPEVSTLTEEAQQFSDRVRTETNGQSFAAGGRGRGTAPLSNNGQEAMDGGRGRGGPRQERGGRGGPRQERGGRGASAALPPLPRGDDEAGVPTFLDGLSEEQLTACYAIMHGAAKRIFVDGPAGTGKTETIARAIAGVLVREPSSDSGTILVVTPTVTAGDVVCRRIIEFLLAMARKLRDNDSGAAAVTYESAAAACLRFYSPGFHPLHCDPLLFPFSNRPYDEKHDRRILEKHMLTNKERFDTDFFDRDDVDVIKYRLIVCAASSVRKLPKAFLSSVKRVLIDEAGSTALAEAILIVDNLPKSTAITFSGDMHQLQPRVLFPAIRHWMNVTPLEYSNGALRVSLNVSYRANSELVAAQSFLFYGGKLKVAKEATLGGDPFPNWSGHGDTPSALRVMHVNGKEVVDRSIVKGGISKTDKERASIVFNKAEVDVVDSIVRTLMAEGPVDPADMAVICEYPQQQRMLRQRLQMVGAKNVKVCTVADTQGSERDVIITSLVRTAIDADDPYALSLPSMCTTTTRARRLAIFVGHIPTHLKRDRQQSGSTKTWTKLVNRCIEKRTVDGYNPTTEEYVGITPLVVKEAIRIREFVPKSARNENAAREQVSVADVFRSSEEFFVGTVTSRKAGRIWVYNRYHCPVDVAVDLDVSSGRREYAVFPGDIVAIRLNPDRSRWQPIVGSVGTVHTRWQTERGQVAPPPLANPILVSDLNRTVTVNSCEFIPMGTLVCVVEQAAMHPFDVSGYVSPDGSMFEPSGLDSDYCPALPLHGHTPVSEEQIRHVAQVIRIPNAEGAMERFYAMVPREGLPALPSGTVSKPEQHHLLEISSKIDQSFFALRPCRGLWQPLASVRQFRQLPSDFAEAVVMVVAPAQGVLTDGAVDLKNASQLWSFDAHDAFRAVPTDRAYPLNTDGSDVERCLAIAQPTTLLLVGVEMRIRFHRGAMYGDVADAQTVMLASRPVVMHREREQAPPVTPEVEAICRDIIRRPGESDMAPRQNEWRQHLLHLAGHAAAETLLRSAPAPLLLRQTAMARSISDLDTDAAALDLPEWYVPTTVTEDGKHWVIEGHHAPSGYPSYTSFAQPYNSYGDVLVQRMLAQQVADRAHGRSAELPAAARGYASRLNAMAQQTF